NIYSDIAAKHLLYSRLVDTVYFGDSYASDDELGTVGNINKDVIELGIVLFNNITQKEMDIILSTEHTNRPDASGYIFRSLESRKYANIGSPIEPNNCISRNAYCLTVDNKKFMRYSGELQICLNELPQDNRVNVVGYIEENSRILTDYIKPGCRVRFKLIKTI
ncbi:MAG TPA: phospho-sugar glycosidase domain-containing protein, partial [Clostridia bacterium]